MIEDATLIEGAITVAFWQLTHETDPDSLCFEDVEIRVMALLPDMPAETIQRYHEWIERNWKFFKSRAYFRAN